MNYADFLKSKVVIARESGFDVKPKDVNAALLPHQNVDYFRDGVGYLQEAEAQAAVPTLFDLLEET